MDAKKTHEISFITLQLEAKKNTIRKLTRTELHDGLYWNKKKKNCIVYMYSAFYSHVKLRLGYKF